MCQRAVVEKKTSKDFPVGWMTVPSGSSSRRANNGFQNQRPAWSERSGVMSSAIYGYSGKVPRWSAGRHGSPRSRLPRDCLVHRCRQEQRLELALLLVLAHSQLVGEQERFDFCPVISAQIKSSHELH